MTPREVVAAALPMSVCSAHEQHALRILAALRDAGFAVVPREPSKDDWLRVCKACGAHPGSSWAEHALEGWRAMLAAAEGETR